MYVKSFYTTEYLGRTLKRLNLLRKVSSPSNSNRNLTLSPECNKNLGKISDGASDHVLELPYGFWYPLPCLDQLEHYTYMYNERANEL